MYDEGVIQFSAAHEMRELPEGPHRALVCRLAAWREIMCHTRMVGQDEGRYGGAGFGNLSGRLTPPSSPMGRRRFLITCSQTGGLPSLAPSDFAVVESYSIRENRVESWGPCMPSSEAMTHAAIYDLSPSIRFVFHGHAPDIWGRARALGLPTTHSDVAYGTQAMAREMQRLYRSSSLSERRVLVMGGHEDGVIAFGRSAREAGEALISSLASAYEMTCR